MVMSYPNQCYNEMFYKEIALHCVSFNHYVSYNQTPSNQALYATLPVHKEKVLF